MFQFSWPRSNGKSNAGMDIEMGYSNVDNFCPTCLMLFADWTCHKVLPSSMQSGRVDENPLCENCPPPIIQVTNTIVQQADSYTLSAFPTHVPQVSTATDPSQRLRVMNSAPQETSLVIAKHNPQPPRSPPRHWQSKSPLPPGSPSRCWRSKSPPIEKVAAAQKVWVVAQEDPQREEEFAIMKRNVTVIDFWIPIPNW